MAEANMGSSRMDMSKKVATNKVVVIRATTSSKAIREAVVMVDTEH
jgi:hypothetical protein